LDGSHEWLGERSSIPASVGRAQRGAGILIAGVGNFAFNFPFGGGIVVPFPHVVITMNAGAPGDGVASLSWSQPVAPDYSGVNDIWLQVIGLDTGVPAGDWAFSNATRHDQP
jgi:hypothetical protein